MSDNKYQHRIPATYIKQWAIDASKEKASVWTYNKETFLWKKCNADNILGVNYFHSIKAGSIFAPEASLEIIWDFLKDYKVIFEERELATMQERNQAFDFYDKWEIYFPNGVKIPIKRKNEIYQKLKSTKDNHIEKEWCRQFEQDWEKTSKLITQTIKDISQGNKTFKLTIKSAEFLMKNIIMFYWRGLVGYPEFNKAFDVVMEVLNSAFSNGESENNNECKNNSESSFLSIYDELKHNHLLSTYEKFLSNTGMMYEHYKKYLDELTFLFLLSPNKDFITSDQPCFQFKNNNGFIEPVFIVNPHMMISLAKKDVARPNSYRVIALSIDEATVYNEHILENCKNIIISTSKFEVSGK